MTDRIRGFDGLRAIAVALVLVMHKTEFGTSTRIGFYGVWLFFFISGYLITGQLYAARERVECGRSGSGRELLVFWYRRAFRILPAYYVVLGLISCYYLASGREVRGFIFYLFHLSNLYFSWNMDEFHTTWAHFWSLAVEEQFYVLFAPLILFVPARHAIKMCIALAIISVIQRIVLTAAGAAPFRIYIDSIVNFGLLAVGGLMCLASKQMITWMARWRLDAGFAGLAALILYIALAAWTTLLLEQHAALLQSAYLLESAIGAFVIANVVAGQRTAFVRALEYPAITLIGRMSYSIYLLNDYVPADIPQRCLSLLARHFDRGRGVSEIAEGSGSLLLSLSGIGLSFLIIFGAAFLFWTFIEKTALTLRDSLASRFGQTRFAVRFSAIPEARRAVVSTTFKP